MAKTDISPAWIVALWNETVTEPLKPAKLTPKRTQQLSQRIKDHGDSDTWTSGIEQTEQSAFCRGRNDRGWVASLSTLCERKDFIAKASEGVYATKLKAVARPRHIDDDWFEDCKERHNLDCNGHRGHLLTLRDEGVAVPRLDALEAREQGNGG